MRKLEMTIYKLNNSKFEYAGQRREIRIRMQYVYEVRYVLNNLGINTHLRFCLQTKLTYLLYFKQRYA